MSACAFPASPGRKRFPVGFQGDIEGPIAGLCETTWWRRRTAVAIGAHSGRRTADNNRAHNAPDVRTLPSREVVQQPRYNLYGWKREMRKVDEDVNILSPDTSRWPLA
jgi:hypothetical protein